MDPLFFCVHSTVYSFNISSMHTVQWTCSVILTRSLKLILLSLFFLQDVHQTLSLIQKIWALYVPLYLWACWIESYNKTEASLSFTIKSIFWPRNHLLCKYIEARAQTWPGILKFVYVWSCLLDDMIYSSTDINSGLTKELGFVFDYRTEFIFNLVLSIFRYLILS